MFPYELPLSALGRKCGHFFRVKGVGDAFGHAQSGSNDLPVLCWIGVLVIGNDLVLWLRACS